LLLLVQCKATKEIVLPIEGSSTGKGIDGFRDRCDGADSVRSVLVKKISTVFHADGERYEAMVTVYALRDSVVYMAAASSGFEIMRAALFKDSTMVIDRINKVLYKTSIENPLGYRLPVGFDDILNVVSHHFLCDDLHLGRKEGFDTFEFLFDEPGMVKRIRFDRETLSLEQFEFTNRESGRFIKGQREAGKFTVSSNFMIDHFIVEVLPGREEVYHNRDIAIRMQVSSRKYSTVYL
jgi:hypothetical protein